MDFSQLNDAAYADLLAEASSMPRQLVLTAAHKPAWLVYGEYNVQDEKAGRERRCNCKWLPEQAPSAQSREQDSSCQ
jgi:hypothetical protein